MYVVIRSCVNKRPSCCDRRQYNTSFYFASEKLCFPTTSVMENVEKLAPIMENAIFVVRNDNRLGLQIETLKLSNSDVIWQYFVLAGNVYPMVDYVAWRNIRRSFMHTNEFGDESLWWIFWHFNDMRLLSQKYFRTGLDNLKITTCTQE